MLFRSTLTCGKVGHEVQALQSHDARCHEVAGREEGVLKVGCHGLLALRDGCEVLHLYASPAQTRKTTSSKKTQTTSQKKATSQKKTTSRKKTSSKKTSKKSSADDVATPSIKGLKNEREQIKKQIAAQKQKLRNNERDVKKRLWILPEFAAVAR